MTRALLFAVTLVALTLGHGVWAQGRGVSPPIPTPTIHSPLPSSAADYWIVPEASAPTSASADRLARAVGLIADGAHAEALALLRQVDLRSTPLEGYVQYYVGLALAGLDRPNDAETALVTARAEANGGALGEQVPLQLAALALSRNDPVRAEDLLADLGETTLTDPADVFFRLGEAAERAGHRDRAIESYRRVFYDHPLTEDAGRAGDALLRLGAALPTGPGLPGKALARAERLFAARRWSDARTAFEPLVAGAAGRDRARIELRLAECAFYLNQHRVARTVLAAFAAKAGPDQAEARYFHLSATRGLGRTDEYVRLVRSLVADHPDSTWSEDALNNLASYYIQADDDATADAVFRDLYRRYPRGRYAERAAWRIGWTAYRKGAFAETASLFESAAVSFPRADTRPAWLYWAARSRDQMNEPAAAARLYRVVVADYQNSYYGRLAEGLLDARRAQPGPKAVVMAGAAPPPSIRTAPIIRALAAAGLYEDALREVRYAQAAWGDSTTLQATQAWLRHRYALTTTADERFQNLRGAITQMRRVYPQFMASGGEQLPPEVLRVIFPLDYWPLIRSHADARGLDPYLMAALTAQESTFTAEIRSAANAYGLMQIIPDTGRTVARMIGLRPFSTASLTDPEVNVRIGTQYFKDLLARFGGAHFALAGYNAGPHRVVRWLADAPGLAQDEFIDNIPFPETQAYVKRILGTAEDYRRLYGPGGPLVPAPIGPAVPRTN